MATTAGIQAAINCKLGEISCAAAETIDTMLKQGGEAAEATNICRAAALDAAIFALELVEGGRTTAQSLRHDLERMRDGTL